MLMKKPDWIRRGQFFHSSQPEDWVSPQLQEAFAKGLESEHLRL
jgi:hypothetical protein